jgi:hypothetical protein
MIMVRRNELACRDEWSRSLWQPRDVAQANGDLPFERPATGPLPPALAESLRSVLNHDTALATSAQGEDVLLSEARIISEEHESWVPQPRPFPVGNFDPRTAIFRAREAYRERARAKATADRQSAGAEATTVSARAEDFTSAAAEEPMAEPSAFLPPDTDTVTSEADAEAHLPNTGSWSEDSIAPAPMEANAALPTAGETSVGQNAEGSPLNANDSNVEGTLPEWRSPPVGGDRIAMEAHERQTAEDASTGQVRAEEVEAEPFPDWYRSDLPRICRTCRDYRPSAEGQRGWCANSWAFTHRRLVLEDDPAPCQSAIGDWWLPVDDVWLVAADVSSHGRATPLLDRLTAKAEQQRRRS